MTALPPQGGRSLLARRWLILSLVIVAGILNYADRQIIALLKTSISADMHWTDVDFSRMASLFQFAAAVAYLFTGQLVDRLGAKWANPVGVGAWSLAAMAHGWARSAIQFGLVRAALGASESMGTPSGIKTVGLLFSPAQRSTAIGAANSAGNIGAIVTPLFVPVLALAVGWRMTFAAVGAVGLIWVAVWLATVRGLSEPAPTASANASPAASGRDGLAGYWGMLRLRTTWAIAGAKALSDQVWWLLLFFAPDLFHRVFGLDLRHLGPPLALIYSCAAIGSAGGGLITTRLISLGLPVLRTRLRVMLVCALLATCAPLTLLTHSYWQAAALIGLLLAAHQGFSVNLFAVISDVAPSGRIGSLTGFGALCGNLAGMGILLVAGEVLAHGLGYGPLLWVAAGSYLAAVAWLRWMLPRSAYVT